MGPNPCGTLNGLLAVIEKVLDKIYNENERTLGIVFHEAKSEVIQQYFPTQYMYGPAYVYTLLGDPALRLRYPTSIEEYDVQQQNIVLFPSVSSAITIPASGRITVISALGDVIIQDTRVQKGSQLSLPTGVYFVKFSHSETTLVNKIVVIR